MHVWPRQRAARRFNIESIWEATGNTPPAVQLDSFRDLLPFVISDGTVRMAVTSVDDTPVLTIWEAEGQPPAFNLTMDPHVMHIGAGEGGIALFDWTASPDQAFTALWEPWSTNRLPAIAYDAIGPDATAIVLNNGTVASIFDNGDISVLWDAEVSDLRAMGIEADEDEALLLLEDGSVLRAVVDGESEGRGTIWDGALSPATQVLLIDS